MPKMCQYVKEGKAQKSTVHDSKLFHSSGEDTNLSFSTNLLCSTLFFSYLLTHNWKYTYKCTGHWSTIPTKTAKSEIFPCRRSRVRELWSHFNPIVEEGWQRPLPLQRLWLVVAKIIIVTAVSIPSETFASVCKKYDMLDIIIIIVCLGVENMVE